MPKPPPSSAAPTSSGALGTTASRSPKPTLPKGEPSVSHMQKVINSSLSRSDLGTSMARRLRRSAPATTESYITYGLTEAYFKSCAAQAPYTIPEEKRTNYLSGKGPDKTRDGEDIGQPESDSWWFDRLRLEPTFSTWSQVSFLHMYIITVRLRALENVAAFRNYQRYLVEHFSQAAEDKMVLLHNLAARGTRNKYLKDLFIQWRGVLAAYDEGLIKGDAVLAAAVWRNLWKADENVDWEKVALVVAYIRRSINATSKIGVQELVRGLDGPNGLWALSRNGLEDVVKAPTQGAAEPLTEAD